MCNYCTPGWTEKHRRIPYDERVFVLDEMDAAHAEVQALSDAEVNDLQVEGLPAFPPTS